MSKSSDDLAQTQIHGENTVFGWQSSRSYRCHEFMWQVVPWWYIHVSFMVRLNQKTKKCGPNTKLCQKPYKCDIEVKGQHRIGIMKPWNTLSHGDRPMCETWFSNVKAIRSYEPDTDLHRQTDWQTDRRSDSFLPLIFVFENHCSVGLKIILSNKIFPIDNWNGLPQEPLSLRSWNLQFW